MKILNAFTLILFMILLISCSSEEVTEEPEPEEEPKEEIVGDYTGTWDDNIYSSFPISAKLVEGRTNFFSGPFFYSQDGSFVPCCMDTDDNGRISFEIKEDSILNFIYDQKLLFYMDGCPGKYTGSGIVTSKGWLNIDFSGDDCDGSHFGGKIVLRK